MANGKHLLEAAETLLQTPKFPVNRKNFDAWQKMVADWRRALRDYHVEANVTQAQSQQKMARVSVATCIVAFASVVVVVLRQSRRRL